MNVAYITMQFNAPSETFARSDVRALSKLGADVSVYSLKGTKENCEDKNRRQDIKVLNGSLKNSFISLISAFFYPL
ncbi:hypothetical protein R0K30_21550, partial [Bacillus sp. SIMBA_154]|uniref:hypothetical protein n=1 Tax=Bacillus sp. SIMBA_154 TaxID=3080859 RepID=UPI00397D695A